MCNDLKGLFSVNTAILNEYNSAFSQEKKENRDSRETW